MIVTTASIIEKIRGLIKDIEKTDGNDAFEYDTDSSFKLGEPYINVSSIKVFVNGSELTSGWVYSAVTNIVTISASLTTGDNIRIIYSYYNKYSDLEIIGYIRANLVRFTQKQYKKTFDMNDSNEIVAVNDENPTIQEGDMIAIVTAIDIDPQNINIKIGNDFSVTATENKSKSELINDVLSEFMRSYGAIDFFNDSL